MYYKNRDIDRENKIVELYNNGYTCTQIEKMLSVNRRSVYRALNRRGVDYKMRLNTICDVCDKEIGNNKNNVTRCPTCQTKVRRFVMKRNAVNYKGGKCEQCGWSGDLSGYDFHHRNPSEKSFEINAKTLTTKNQDVIFAELDKCDLLCALCHRLEHSDYKNKRMLEVAGIKKDKHGPRVGGSITPPSTEEEFITFDSREDLKAELMKCVNDPEYFAKKYVKIK